jgi:hypothetical protein
VEMGMVGASELRGLARVERIHPAGAALRWHA